MRRNGRRIGGGAVIVLLGFVGVRHLLHDRAHERAERTKIRLEARYGESCVAVLDGENHPERILCHVGGLRADSVMKEKVEYEELITVFTLCLDPPTAASSRVVVDAFTADGQPLGSTKPIHFFDGPPAFGRPSRQGLATPKGSSFPFVVAIRAARPEE